MSPSCPFCGIAATNPPIPFNESESSSSSPDRNSDPTAHLILSTEHVLAFLDIMPLTRGHVLVTPRRHFEMLGDMDVQTGQEVRGSLPHVLPKLRLSKKLAYLLSTNLISKYRLVNGFPFFRGSSQRLCLATTKSDIGMSCRIMVCIFCSHPFFDLATRACNCICLECYHGLDIRRIPNK